MAMRSAALLTAGLLLLIPGTPAPAVAQTDTGSTSWIVSVSRYGKWVTLGGAAGLTAIAISRNDDADAIFGALVTFCRNAPEQCVRQASGTYVGGDAERLYQETLRIDRQARVWMIAGQVTLAASGAMFLIDLITGDQDPKNIPYTPFEVVSGPRRLGVGIRF